jgi:hypothetical protein
MLERSTAMTEKSLTTKKLADGVVSAGYLSKACYYELLITGEGATYGPREIDLIIAALQRRIDARSDPRLPDLDGPFYPALYIRARAQLGYRDYISDDKKCWVTTPASRHPDADKIYSADVDFWLNEWAHAHDQEKLRPLVFDYMLSAGRIGEQAALDA